MITHIATAKRGFFD